MQRLFLSFCFLVVTNAVLPDNDDIVPWSYKGMSAESSSPQSLRSVEAYDSAQSILIFHKPFMTGGPIQLLKVE